MRPCLTALLDAPLYFILGTGLRAAELTGLRWSDIKDNHFTVAQMIRRNRDFSDNAECKTFLETSTPKTRAGLPLRGVHALRHTFATRAMESGMDLRTLSEILGHSQVALTLQLYAHSTIETKCDVMEKMDVFL